MQEKVIFIVATVIYDVPFHVIAIYYLEVN